MKTFANKTAFTFDQLPASFSLAATGADIYTTPDECSVKVGDLARLVYLRSDLAGTVEADSATTAVVTVRLTNGVTDYASVQVDMNGATRQQFTMPAIDLSSVAGTEKLKLAVDVDTLEAAKTAKVAGRLDVEHPVVFIG